jgi:toxin ParE1/3/4
MKPFDLTRKARADLRAIAIFTEEQWGVEQRNLYIKQFDDIFHMLAASPLMGKNCDEVTPGYRKFPQGSHVVFYKEGSSCVIEVVRILHKSMDVEMWIHGT